MEERKTLQQAQQAQQADEGTNPEHAAGRGNGPVLLHELLSAGGGRGQRERLLRALEVPSSPARIAADPNDGSLRFAVLDASSSRRAADDGATGAGPVFELLAGSGGEQLLMLAPPGSSARLNGLPAPLVAPLALGDQVMLDAGSVLHVSRFHSAAARPTPAELVGSPCAVCLTPFTADTQVRVCPICGSACHLEGESVPEDERLECARLGGACPQCQTELPETDGYAFWPED